MRSEKNPFTTRKYIHDKATARRRRQTIWYFYTMIADIFRFHFFLFSEGYWNRNRSCKLSNIVSIFTELTSPTCLLGFSYENMQFWNGCPRYHLGWGIHVHAYKIIGTLIINMEWILRVRYCLVNFQPCGCMHFKLICPSDKGSMYNNPRFCHVILLCLSVLSL